MANEDLSPGTILSNPKSKGAVIYTRVSTSDQHPETHLYDLRELAKQRRYEIVSLISLLLADRGKKWLLTWGVLSFCASYGP